MSALLCCCLSIFCCAPSCASPTQPASPVEWVSLAGSDIEPISLGPKEDQVRLAMQQERWREAARLIKGEQAPQLFLKAWCFAQAEDWKQVLRWLTGLQDHPVLGDEVNALIATASFKSGQFDNAVEAGQKVSTVDQTLWRSNVRQLGQALRALERWDEARSAYRQLGESPDIFDRGISALGIGMVELERGQLVQGLNQLRRVLVTYPGKWVATQADREARRIIKLHPEHRQLWGTLSPAEKVKRAEGLLTHHQHQRAFDLATSLRKLKLSDELACRSQITLGRAAAKLKRTKAALNHLKKAIDLCHPQRHSQTPFALYVAGRSALRLNDRENADRFFSILLKEYQHRLSDDAAVFLIHGALEARFTDKAASSNTAKLLSAKQLSTRDRKRFTTPPKEKDLELERVMDTVRQVINKHPKGDLTTEALTFALVGVMRAGRLDLAQKILTLAEQLPARSFRFHDAGRLTYWRGRLQSLLGARDQAIQTYQQVIANAPISWYALMAYSRLYEWDKTTAQEVVRTTLNTKHKGLGLPGGETHRWDWRFRTDDPHWALMHRALMWMRLGLFKRGRKAFRALSSNELRPDLQWLSAWALDGYQQYHWSHDILRRKLIEYRHFSPSGHHLKHWLIAYPRPYEREVMRAERAEGVPSAFIWGVMREESGYAERIRSSANAVGLLQLILPTAKMMKRRGEADITVERLGKPSVNIPLGARYLSWVKRNLSCAWQLVPAGYNAGGGALKGWLKSRGTLPLDLFVETIPYEEARWYTKRVNASWITFRTLYGAPKGEFVWPYVSQRTLVPEDDPPSPTQTKSSTRSTKAKSRKAKSRKAKSRKSKSR